MIESIEKKQLNTICHFGWCFRGKVIKHIGYCPLLSIKSILPCDNACLATSMEGEGDIDIVDPGTIVSKSSCKPLNFGERHNSFLYVLPA